MQLKKWIIWIVSTVLLSTSTYASAKASAEALMKQCDIHHIEPCQQLIQDNTPEAIAQKKKKILNFLEWPVIQKYLDQNLFKKIPVALRKKKVPDDMINILYQELLNIIVNGKYLDYQDYYSSIKKCDDATNEENPDRTTIQTLCKKAASKGEALEEYGSSVRYLLLANELDKVIAHAHQIVNPLDHANVAHAWLLQGNYKQAEYHYKKLLSQPDRKMVDHIIQGDFALLRKLYPEKSDEIDKGITLWQKILPTDNIQAILKLDTGGHTGIIRDIIVTKSGDILSASDDKTIRVWDSKSGQEKRKILGQIGSGSGGKIYAIALSPDEKYLAVGGYLAGKELSDIHAIRIYHYPSGKLLKVLKSHTNVVFDLSFSPDGQYLISGSGDKTARIWKSPDFTLVDTITFHKKQVYAVKILKKKKRYFALTAGDDKKIALYDMEYKKIIRSHTLDHAFYYLAASREHIAACDEEQQIHIYDHDLQPVKIIHTETKPSGLAYSPNGKWLISGFNYLPSSVNIYNTTNDYQKIQNFTKHTEFTGAVAFLDDQTAVSGGGNNKEIYVWDIHTGEVKQKIEGAGTNIWSVGIQGEKIAWGTVDPCPECKTMGNAKGKLQKTIDLNTFMVNADPGDTLGRFQRIPTTNGSYSLSHRKGKDDPIVDTILDIKKDGKVVASIKTSSGHTCYGFYKDYIISGDYYGKLWVYDLKGKTIARLVGHTGMISSIALDGDRLISGSDDQTIQIWNLNQLDNLKPNFVSPSWFGKSWREYIAGHYPHIDIQRPDNIPKLYYLLKAENDSDAEKLLAPPVLHPALSLFISRDNEWVAWTPSGYYDASTGGDRFVGYYINQGTNKEARFVQSDAYFDTLYRPDIIQLILQTGNEQKAIAFADKNKKVHTIDVTTSLPPALHLLSPDHVTTTKETVTIHYSVDSHEPITQTVITLNGRRLDTRAIVRKQRTKEQTLTIPLDEGENIIAVRARNKFALSDEILVYATRKGKTDSIYKPSLYLLSIGISQYKNTTYNLSVADKDAQAVAHMFQKQKGKIYKEVYTKILTNDQAQSDDILDALDWIDKEATSKDVVVVFIAGHGVNDDKGNYYFLAHEANIERLRRTAVRWTEIQDTIVNLPSKVILLVDTCHSGNIAGVRRDITSAVKSIINGGTGRIIMTATTGSGYSYEQPDWGHGAFTKALIEGIDNAQADYNHDQAISIKEIDLYVTERVKTLTHGKQKPTTIVPQSIPDFMVGVK